MFKLYVSRCRTLVISGMVLVFLSTGFGVELVKKGQTPEGVESSRTTQMVKKNLGSYKSYKEWKMQMVENAKQRLEKSKQSFEHQLKLSHDKKNKDPNLSQQIAKEQLQLFMSNELSITDYFVGYLNKQSNLEEAIKSTSGKLTADEVAELMSAFAYNFNKKEMTEAQAFINASPSRTSD